MAKKGPIGSTIRDANNLVILEPVNVVAHADISSGVIFPIPEEPARVFRVGFEIVQIVVLSNEDFYWELQTNVNASGSPMTNIHRIIRGSALTQIAVPNPLAIRAECVPESQCRFKFDSSPGGMGAPPLTGSLAARVQIYGYWMKSDSKTRV